MAQTVQLALGTTAATSSTIIVAANAEAVIGIYADVGQRIAEAGSAFSCTLVQVTPGADNQIGRLDAAQPTIIVRGPNSYKVVRPGAAVPVGVFSEGV